MPSPERLPAVPSAQLPRSAGNVLIDSHPAQGVKKALGAGALS